MSRAKKNNKSRYTRLPNAEIIVYRPGSGDEVVDLGPLGSDCTLTIAGKPSPGDRLTVLCYGGGTARALTINGSVGGGPNIQLGAFDFFGAEFVCGVAGDGITPNYICTTAEILFNNLP